MSVLPNDIVIRFGSYLVTGYGFHAKGREFNKKTQNSSVVMSAKTESYSTTRGLNPILGIMKVWCEKEMIELISMIL